MGPRSMMTPWRPTSTSAGSSIRREGVRTLTPIRRLCLLLVPLLAGCAHVPGEVVQLSYSVGQDLVAVQASYEALVTQQIGRAHV